MQISEREVRVNGSRFIATDDYWIKLEGARRRGYRTITVAGVRCPTMVARIDTLLADAKAAALAYFAAPDLDVQFHVYGRDGVMRGLEPVRKTASHELGLVIEAVAHEQSLAHAAAHFLSGTLLHVSFLGMYNTAGNLAFPYSPSEVDAGPVYEFSTYHLLKTVSPTALFPIHHEVLAS